MGRSAKIRHRRRRRRIPELSAEDRARLDAFYLQVLEAWEQRGVHFQAPIIMSGLPIRFIGPDLDG